MPDPLLSVTVTNYNYARFLPRTIESILGQRFTDFELILIDNASEDDSRDVMHRYAAQDPRIRLVEHPTNLGLFASLRESGALSRGRYRVPIEADDWILSPDAFEVQVEMLERHPSVVFVYSAMTMIGSDDRIHHVSRPYESDVVVEGAEALEAILSFSLLHTGMMMRTAALRAARGYREDLPHVPDMALGVELCELGDVGYIDRSLYAFRQHTTNLHLEGQVDLVAREVLPLIDETFGGQLGSKIADASAVRRRVIQRALVHLPTQHIFSGDLAGGWRLYWESVKLAPVLTVLQLRTASLLSRTVLGERRHTQLVRRLGRGKDPGYSAGNRSAEPAGAGNGRGREAWE